MREFRLSGSVRGAKGDFRPYRDMKATMKIIKDIDAQPRLKI
ncbi:hypothetical protein [Chlorobium phaeovibrioides]|nr:hypothetical protein [Chlorobium phaeovibrioides]